MTQQVRINFLNWRPDQEPLYNDGLTLAQNTYHDVDGYKPVRFATEGSVSTVQAVSSLSSVQIRQIGSLMDASSKNKILCRLVNNAVAVLSVYPPGLSSLAATSVSLKTANGTEKACSTAPAITAFQVCELENKVFITAEAKGTGTSGTALSANITAYMDIDI